jgi:hypothetical protein
MSMSQYRAFIDHMVGLAKICVHADRLRARGHAERTNERDVPLSAEESARKQVMLSLTRDQCEAVARLLIEERVGAIHDVLANLPAFDFELEGQSLWDQADEMPHGDFLGRFEGWWKWREVTEG